MRSRSREGEGLVDVESLLKPRAFNRAASPGEGLRACRGLRWSDVTADEEEDDG